MARWTLITPPPPACQTALDALLFFLQPVAARDFVFRALHVGSLEMGDRSSLLAVGDDQALNAWRKPPHDLFVIHPTANE